MKLRRIPVMDLLLTVFFTSCWQANATADDGAKNSRNNSLPKGEVKFRFSAYANNVKVLPPLVAGFQLGISRITGAGVIKDGKVTGALEDTDQSKRGTRWLKAKIVGGSYSKVGVAHRLSLKVQITNSSHPTDEAAPGVTGTLELQDSPTLLANGKPHDTVGLGGWSGEVRTHIHGYNNQNPGPRTHPPTGGPPKGGQWADVVIDGPIDGPAGNISGVWKSDFGPLTLHVRNGHVTGSWKQGKGKIGKIIGGAYDPQRGTLIFKYFQNWNKQNGTATLRLSSYGQRLTGRWKQPNGSGTWTMTR